MGLILALLLLLNLGQYQEFYIALTLKRERARVFNWLEANWILPTIALAYGVLFIVELVLAYFAKRATLAAKAKAVRDSTMTTTLSVGGTEILEHLRSGTVDEKQSEGKRRAKAGAVVGHEYSGRLFNSLEQHSLSLSGVPVLAPPAPMLDKKEGV
ncbi:hypothetical protein B0J17DRAFT_423868 [Rhizoctonia solani]|nr:hypothetical protein B0J17DRAFT_423868 [Rhizoctonia solani]